MSKLKILRNTVCGGKNVKAGDVVEASPRDTKLLLDMGKAEIVEGNPKKVAAKGKAKIESRDDVSLETREPAAAMTTKSAKALK